MLQVGSNKYERTRKDAQKKGLFLVEHQLICVTDGSVMTHFDDGPRDPTLPANPGRQKLIAAVAKRILVDGEKVPVFYATKKGMEVFDNLAGRPIPVPFYDDAAKALTEKFLEHRRQSSAIHRAQWDGEKKRYTKKGAEA